MLASLQADGDAAATAAGDESDAEANEEANAERLTIESTIQITDEIVAQKDRELAELKLLLSQQSDSIGSVAVGAAAIAGVLGQDELIRQEREKLNSLQEECAKSSAARKSTFPSSGPGSPANGPRSTRSCKASNRRACGSQPGEPGGGATSDSGKKPVRGRWLAGWD